MNFIQCRGSDSNRHGSRPPQDFKSNERKIRTFRSAQHRCIITRIDTAFGKFRLLNGAPSFPRFLATDGDNLVLRFRHKL